MRVDIQLGSLSVLLAAAFAANAQVANFTPAATAGAAPVAAIAAPALDAALAPSAATSQPSPNLAATLAAMHAGAPTIGLLSDIQRREREADVAARLAKISAATAPPPAPAPAPVKVVKPRVLPGATVQEGALKRVLAIYGAEGDEMADVAMPDGSIQTVRAGHTYGGFKVLSVSGQAVRVDTSRLVKVSNAEAKAQGRKGDGTKTVHSTLEVPVGSAFH
jgi:hypothetical protein